jgi:hypothetical protein
MLNIKVTVGNDYAPHIIEEFFTRVDIKDIDEVEACAAECCGQYLDMHGDIWYMVDVDMEEIAEACWYMIEEVSAHDLP